MEIEKVWIINGAGDEGCWEIQAFGTFEKAVARMIEYVKEFERLFPDARWEIEDGYTWARYDSDNYYDTFWIEELKVR